MTYTLSNEEFESVSSCPAGVRYSHVIKRVCDWETVYVDSLDGRDAKFALRIWPHAEYARRFFGLEAEPWIVGRFISWLDRPCDVRVFPTGADEGPLIRSERLRRDLSERLEQIR